MLNRKTILEQIRKLENYTHEDSEAYLIKLYEDQIKYLREKLRSGEDD